MVVKLEKLRSKEIMYFKELKNNKTPILTSRRTLAKRVSREDGWSIIKLLESVYGYEVRWIKLEDYDI